MPIDSRFNDIYIIIQKSESNYVRKEIAEILINLSMTAEKSCNILER